jgi:hypothetical protein
MKPMVIFWVGYLSNGTCSGMRGIYLLWRYLNYAIKISKDTLTTEIWEGLSFPNRII